MFFLLVNILITIGYAQDLPDAIDCNSAVEGTTTNDQGFAVFNFYLAENSYVEINTCGSDFDTSLTLMDTANNLIAQNDNGNDQACGPMNAIIDAGVLPAGTYNIILYPGAGMSQFGSYDLALGCNPDGTPTIPDANGIPVESDCNFVKDGQTIQPLDTCSLSLQDTSGGSPFIFSRKYECNSQNNGIVVMYYESVDCAGDPYTDTIHGPKQYYYNCAGSNDACDLGIAYTDCPESTAEATQAIRMFECYGTEFSMNTYYDDDCLTIRNISYAPDSENGCTFTTECGGGNCDINRLDDSCENDLDCPSCMQCCPKREVCEFPPYRAESVLNSINQLDWLHGIEGVGTSECMKDITIYYWLEL